MKKKFKSISWAMDELAAMPVGLRGAVYSLVDVLEENGTLAYPDGGLLIPMDESSRYERTFTVKRRASCIVTGTKEI